MKTVTYELVMQVPDDTSTEAAYHLVMNRVGILGSPRHPIDLKVVSMTPAPRQSVAAHQHAETLESYLRKAPRDF